MKFLSLILALVLPLSAQVLTEKQINERVEAAKTLPDDEASKAILAAWQEASQFSREAAQATDTATQFTEKTKKPYADVALSIPDAPAPEAGLPEYAAFLETLNMALANSKEKKAELDSEASVSAQKNSELGELLAKTKADLAALEIPATASGEFGQAEMQRALKQKASLEATLERIQAEQSYLRFRAESFPKRMTRRNEQLSTLNTLLTEVGKKVKELREKEAQSTSDSLDAFQKKFSDIPRIAAIIKEIRELNARRTGEEGVDAKLQEAKRYLEEVQGIKASIEEQSKTAKNRIQLLRDAGLNVDTETGLQLRNQRAFLPKVSELEAELRKHAEIAAQSQIKEIELQARRSSPLITPEQAREILAQHPEVTQADIDSLTQKRRDLITSLVKDYQNLTAKLSEATTSAKLTIVDIKNYSAYLDERLLWIKSTNPLNKNEPLEEWRRVVALFSPSMLEDGLQEIQRSWLSRLIPAVLLLLFFFFSILRRRRLFEILESSCKEAARRNCTSILPTLKTIGASLFLASGLPALVFLFALLLRSTNTYANGLTNMGIFLLISGILLKFSRKNGLFTAHLKVDPTRSQLVHRSIAWLIPVGAPIAFLVGALLVEGSSSHSSGRLVFMLAMVLVGCFTHRILHPSRSIFHREGVSNSLVRTLYFLFMAIPVILAIGAALGYFASVLTLRAQVIATLGLLVLAFLIIRFFNRWILVSRRKLAISQALRRREAAIAERERVKEGEETTGEKDAALPTLEEVKAEAVDVVEVEAQTAQLVRLSVCFAVFFGIWGVWSSTLPALRILDEVHLWGGDDSASQSEQKSSSSGISMMTPGASSDSKAEEGDKSEEGSESKDSKAQDKVPESIKPRDNGVSLQDFFLAILIGVITFIAARNIPSLLSLTVFSRINLGPGGNFALTTVVRYLIVLIGVVLALDMIGITWGKVQWLAAAVTLGIGFGLQEIFANFVAGIIMLFERPIRLGDIVTVGDVSGKVTQINIRATTIQQFNNRELLVPNKEFITSQLVNWTLRDTILRFELIVGIAYGSDTRKAAGILEKILAEHPKVLKEPGPAVLFSAFGASTLDFTIRAFVGFVEDLVVTQSEIHYLIDDAFREAGIEIAFPQQDIHIRSVTGQFVLPSQS